MVDHRTARVGAPSHSHSASRARQNAQAGQRWLRLYGTTSGGRCDSCAWRLERDGVEADEHATQCGRATGRRRSESGEFTQPTSRPSLTRPSGRRARDPAAAEQGGQLTRERREETGTRWEGGKRGGEGGGGGRASDVTGEVRDLAAAGWPIKKMIRAQAAILREPGQISDLAVPEAARRPGRATSEASPRRRPARWLGGNGRVAGQNPRRPGQRRQACVRLPVGLPRCVATERSRAGGGLRNRSSRAEARRE